MANRRSLSEYTAERSRAFSGYTRIRANRIMSAGQNQPDIRSSSRRVGVPNPGIDFTLLSKSCPPI
jgi:hypothetical protein